jgi:hypothetical protein
VTSSAVVGKGVRSRGSDVNPEGEMGMDLRVEVALEEAGFLGLGCIGVVQLQQFGTDGMR